MEDGGQNRRACGPTHTNQIWQSPSFLFALVSHLLPLPLLCSIWSSFALRSILRHTGADSKWPARSKALSYSGRWCGWRKNQISQGRSLALNFSIHPYRMFLYSTYPERPPAARAHRVSAGCWKVWQGLKWKFQALKDYLFWFFLALGLDF